MIKVGQVWQQRNDEIALITNIEDKNVSLLYPDGYAITEEYNEGFYFNYVFYKLIAEYTTWQEAVNGKEFKGEV